MNKGTNSIVAALGICTLLVGSAQAQTNGFQPISDSYTVQYPANVSESQRFTVTNGLDGEPLYTCWCYGTDAPAAQASGTDTRTEMRWQTWANQTVANQFSFDELFSAGTQNTCIHQIKSDNTTGVSGGGGGEAIYVQVNQPGTLRNSVGANFASGIANTWFHINSIYDPTTGHAQLYYNGSLVYSTTSFGPYPNGDWYFKTGAYDNGMPTNAEAWVQISNVVHLVQFSGFQLSVSPVSQTMDSGQSTNYTLTVTTNSTFTGSVAFGIAGLPSGATASFVPSTLSTNGNSTLTVQTTTGTSGGAYVLTLYTTNNSFIVVTNINLLLIGIGSNPGTLLWSGASGTDTNWSTGPNWTNVTVGGYGPPIPTNSLEFTNIATAASPSIINNVVNTNFTVTSLQYANNALNTSPNYQVTFINSGKKLVVTNSLIVGTATDAGAGNVVNAAITGANGTLILSNSILAVTQGSGSDGPHQAVLDLSGLGTLNMTNATKIAVAVYQMPGQNGNGGQRSSGVLYLAETNFISVTSTGVTNGILVGLNDSQGNGNSSGVPNPADDGSALYLGQTNVIYTDAIYVGTDKSLGCLLAFNPNGLNNPTAFIRGIGGASSRVSLWGIGDTSMKSGSNQSASGTNDFTGGTVNALVGNMNVGVTQTSSSGGNTGNGTGVLTFSAGTINANNLTNGWSVGTGTTAGSDVGTGTINVNGTATLKVNNILALAQNTGSGTGVPSGTLNVNGGTVDSTNIMGGGGISTINLNSGLMDLQSTNPLPGQIANLSTLNVGDNSVDDPALLANAAIIMASNAIVIAPNGTLAGNTVLTSPGLVVNGTISPGVDGIGWMTNKGPVTLGAGGDYMVTVQDALAGPSTGWSFLQVNNGINVQATSGNPFTISLLTSGLAANFNYNTNYDWVIAMANNGLTNFNANAFAADNSQFGNDLAGGYFHVRAIGNSLILSFTNNHPPVAGITWLYRTGSTMAIPISSLSSNWSDPDGDPVVLMGVNGSTNGAMLGSDANFIYYTNANDVADEILYTVEDIRTNPPAVYRPGDTQQTGVGQVIILPPPAIGGITLNNGSLSISGSGGISNGVFYVLCSTNLALPVAQWTCIATNSFDQYGNFNLTTPTDPNQPQLFYLLQVP